MKWLRKKTFAISGGKVIIPHEVIEDGAVIVEKGKIVYNEGL